ncbi:hypothetical protein SDC9_176494 [bioreactor metagenome]|uniref:Uncharacterized protein n=1 Tax=bioreactor metagenome TaxID=1076179 RepID=A0A645GS50_9ZZZZ
MEAKKTYISTTFFQMTFRPLSETIVQCNVTFVVVHSYWIFPVKKDAFQAIDKPKGKGRISWGEFTHMG